MSKHCEAVKLVYLCAWREFIRNVENTLAMSKLMHRLCVSSFLVKNAEWFMVSVAVVLQEC